MKNQKFAVKYQDLLDGVISSETCLPCELHFWLEDERRGEIQILEIDQTFDGWETMEVLYRVS